MADDYQAPATSGAVASIEIMGLRGFATCQRLQLAAPNGKAGSGITVLVGPNNAGKSTIVEALRAMARTEPPSFAEGQRNRLTGDKVMIELRRVNGEAKHLRSIGASSETEWDPPVVNPPPNSSTIYVLPSRRTFRPFFSQLGTQTRGTYLSGTPTPDFRGAALDYFPARLFAAQRNKEAFDAVLGRALGEPLDWVIERSDSGNYYLKLRRGGSSHSSDGLGEGVVSVMLIVDALYDSSPGDLIVIDEPELSLHPSLQKRLFLLIAEYASDRQVLYATHSPYFVDWENIANGATISRVHAGEEGTFVSTPARETLRRVVRLTQDLHNVHVIGLDAREVFFLQEQVILVEGQDDVLAYRKIAKHLGIEIAGDFFGWGVGGAGNMPLIARLLCQMGFTRVVGILDSNKQEDAASLQSTFPGYKFFTIPTADVRSKPAQGRQATNGLLDERWAFREEYRTELSDILTDAGRYLRSAGGTERPREVRAR